MLRQKAWRAGWVHGRLQPVAAPLPASPPNGIALFDLDGTLLAWDCQLLFRHFVLRREPWRGVFLPVFLVFLPIAGLLGPGRMKRVFLSFLWRMSPEKLAAYSRDFASHVMPAIYPEVRAELERHRASGDLLILASASPEFYVLEIGRELGFDLTLGTVVETGAFFPRLVNHKGSAKVTRLKKELPASYFKNGKTPPLPRLHRQLCGPADARTLRFRHRGESSAAPCRACRTIRLAHPPAMAALEEPDRFRTASAGTSNRLGPRSRRTQSAIRKKSRMTSR
jgi:phosphoserine phosphatase